MSQKNRDGKGRARDRMREEREREKAAEKRMRVLKVGGTATAVLAVAAVVGVLAANSGGSGSNDGPAAEPITVGQSTAPATLTVYEDFRCPACGQFENGFRDVIHELTDAGTLKAEYHLVSIIDGNIRGDGSKNAANAAQCANDQGSFAAYHDVLFENQPAEADDAFGDKDLLIDLAGQVDGLDNAEFRTCVQEGTHDDWVQRSNADFMSSDFNATPTILLNGENIYGDPSVPLTPDSLRNQVNQLAAGS
ncbi:DsbA family protein [Streptomyces carpaticus]|uniref:DsbA family protein n=1 Tax=Streptomyces TaxID=1883 RepID=UPI00030699F3|nr:MULTISPECIES: thioredoxin domain-containing protein [Streptomyces]MCK1814580.1 DsbA family protein [Streptomyces sp. XM4011]QKV68278.1 thioredoxin domain-containing protein [Streptomyces harbinensis]UWM48614.1 DsbA family protein [Streptomyces carpaticus]